MGESDYINNRGNSTGIEVFVVVVLVGVVGIGAVTSMGDGGGGEGEVYLFSIEENVDSVTDNLDDENISKHLRDRYDEGDYTLSENVSISVEENGKEWDLNDKNEGYNHVVRKEDGELNIYGELKLSLDNGRKGTNNGVETGPEGFFGFGFNPVVVNKENVGITGAKVRGGTGPGENLHILTVYFKTEGSGTENLGLTVDVLASLELDEELDEIGTPQGIDGEVDTDSEAVFTPSSTSVGDVWFENYTSTSSGFSVEVHANTGSSKLAAYTFVVGW